MAQRELVLLSPYRLPSRDPVTLSDDDMAAWLNGYTALWHPLALSEAAGPPRVDSSYNHETPKPGCVYAVPVSPPSLLSESWEERVHDAGAFFFQALPDRAATLANMKAALPPTSAEPAESAVAAFFGVGFGYLLLAALSDAMEHENLLVVHEFWNDVQLAVAGASETAGEGTPRWFQSLQAAAMKLMTAREALYPVTIHLLDSLLLQEQNLQDPWPVTVSYGQPVNVIATGSALQDLLRQNTEAVASLAQAIKEDRAELCGGDYLEREEPLLPLESQLWNLGKGLEFSRRLLASDLRTYARWRFGAHPQLPMLLNQHGITRAVLFGQLPAYTSPVVSWATIDGQQIDCFVRRPLPTDNVDTFFNLGHFLYKTIREDHTATLAFVHGKKPALPWYSDLLELSRLADVAGRWTTFTNYFDQATAGEHAGALGADDFQFDYLSDRSALPVSGFAQHLRLRRRLDSCWTLAAMQRGLAGPNDPQHVDADLQNLEDEVECSATKAAPQPALDRLAELETVIAASLADRLVARAQKQEAGYLLLNPCGFTRRIALELDNRGSPIPVADPVRAVQVDGDKLRVVAEVPSLGFAWLPQAGPPGTAQPASRMRLADERCVRNEFFEAEIDPATGGLRAIRDHKTMVNRLSERLIFRPGSVMKATQIKTTSTGPALGEIVTEGILLGSSDQHLARFRQRFRAWLGRPILDLRVELFTEQPPAGSPWHAYFGAQFAWRDERATLQRGQGGMAYATSQLRPQTPDYLEIRLARHSTTIFPGGLPFHQREGGRMIDIILVSPGETCHIFDLAIGLDREQPMQTALGLATPPIIVPTVKGPPHVGARGWLFHLDAANLLLTSMRPGGRELWADGAKSVELTDAITARLLEIAGVSTMAEFRCVRNPAKVDLLDARGKPLTPGTQNGDAAQFQIGPGNLVQLQVQFSMERHDALNQS